MNQEKATKLLRDHASVLCRSSVSVPTVLRMRSDGVDVGPSRRDELLTKIASGAHVEIEIDYLAFEQTPDTQNRKNVRFRDGILIGLGRSGVGTPFLRDHEQDELEARGGTVIASKTTKVGEGHYQIHQTAKLTAPWAVDACLRGNIDRFSIGWFPSGDVECSACKKQIFTKCFHLPGDRLSENDGEYVSDPTGDYTVEWIFNEAELIETSAVSVPAVPSAQIEGVRMSLSAALQEIGFRPTKGQEEKEMLDQRQAIAAALGLAATAGENEILGAVTGMRAKLDAVDAQVAELQKLQARLAAEAEIAREQLSARELEEFISAGVAEGKLVPGSAAEQSLRNYHKVDKAGAASLLASLPRVTPVGAPRLSANPDPVPAATTLRASVDEQIRQHGGTPQGVESLLRQLGCKPSKVLPTFGARAFGLVTEEE